MFIEPDKVITNIKYWKHLTKRNTYYLKGYIGHEVILKQVVNKIISVCQLYDKEMQSRAISLKLWQMCRFRQLMEYFE